MSDQVELSGEDCHLVMLPVCPLRSMEAVEPLQTALGVGVAVPPTEAGDTVILTEAELAALHGLLCTTARNQVSAVNAPIVAPLKVVLVPAISVGDVKAASLDFCHLVTLPVFPLRVRSDGWLPVQIVCGDDTVPPTEAAATVTVVVVE